MPNARGHHSVDEYLAAIHALLHPVGAFRPGDAAQPIASRVAARLSVSRASVGEMLNRLTEQGLVRRGRRHEIALTPAGLRRAEAVIRRQRILERFLTDYLDYGSADVGEQAAVLGAAMQDDMVEAIHARLGHPDRCPHGWPVDPGGAPEALQALADLEAGAAAEIACVTEDDPALLRWFADEGLTPGARIEVREVQPAAGHLRVALDGEGERVIAEKAARQLFVRDVPVG